jgi:hypothetical protein
MVRAVALLSLRETERVQVFIRRLSLGLDQGTQQHLISTAFGSPSEARDVPGGPQYALMPRALRGRFEPLDHFVLGHLCDPWAPLCPWVAARREVVHWSGVGIELDRLSIGVRRKSEAEQSLACHTPIDMNIAVYLITGLLVGLLLPQLVMIWLGSSIMYQHKQYQWLSCDSAAQGNAGVKKGRDRKRKKMSLSLSFYFSFFSDRVRCIPLHPAGKGGGWPRRSLVPPHGNFGEWDP